MRSCHSTLLLAAAALLLALLLAPADVTAAARLELRRGQRASIESSMHSEDAATDVAVSHVAARRSAMERVGQLRLRARAAAEGEAQSALALGAAATLKAAAWIPGQVTRRGAGGKAGRAGVKAGVAAGNGGQSGRKAGNAAGNGGQSGRKAGDAAGNGGQSGRKAGDASGNGGQSGRKAGDASGNGGQSGRKAGDLPVSPITGSAPPDATNVVTLAEVKRSWPVKVYLRNQGDAATCWAHSALTLLELRQQMALARSLLPTWYSVDQVVKCVKNDGADGGSPLDALEFIINAQLMSDSDVRAGKPITCNKIDWSKRNSNDGRYGPLIVLKPCITPGENCARMVEYEFAMMRQFMLSPMLAYVDASQWHTYAPKFNAAQAASYALGTAADYSGVAFPLTKCSMDPVKGDHLVILLGTVTCPKTKKTYWRVYNSWGKEWGVNGYIYLEYEKNACGLANYPVGLDLLPSFRDVSFGESKALLLVPRSMSKGQALASAEFKARGISVVGGKEQWDAFHPTNKK